MVDSETPILAASASRQEVERPTAAAPRWDAAGLITPPRSPLISWTVRLAQLADRFVGQGSGEAASTSETPANLADKTLDGLERCWRLLPVSHEVLAAERVRLELDKLLRTRRGRYARFEQLRSVMLQSEPTCDPFASYLHLNPVCRWVRQTEQREPPTGQDVGGSVLYFLSDGEVRGLEMNLEGQVLMNELADYQPCTVLQWSRLSALADAQQLTTLAERLILLGLVARSGGE